MVVAIRANCWGAARLAEMDLKIGSDEVVSQRVIVSALAIDHVIVLVPGVLNPG